jgi:hypothetical protein
MRAIYRLGVTGKQFADVPDSMASQQEMPVKNASKAGNRGYLTWVVAIVLAVGILFWLEWMGSEQPQHVIEIPITAPKDKTS